MRVSNKKRVFKKRGTLKKTRKFKKYGGSSRSNKSTYNHFLDELSNSKRLLCKNVIIGVIEKVMVENSVVNSQLTMQNQQQRVEIRAHEKQISTLTKEISTLTKEKSTMTQTHQLMFDDLYKQFDDVRNDFHERLKAAGDQSEDNSDSEEPPTPKNKLPQTPLTPIVPIVPSYSADNENEGDEVPPNVGFFAPKVPSSKPPQ